MPFDGNETDHLTYAGLSAVLRDRSLWPEGFEWNYSKCGTCAMGLVYRLKTGEWLDETGDSAKRTRAVIVDGNAMSLKAFDPIFWYLNLLYNRAITPEDVADAIDRAMAEQNG